MLGDLTWGMFKAGEPVHTWNGTVCCILKLTNLRWKLGVTVEHRRNFLQDYLLQTRHPCFQSAHDLYCFWLALQASAAASYSVPLFSTAGSSESTQEKWDKTQQLVMIQNENAYQNHKQEEHRTFSCSWRRTWTSSWSLNASVNCMPLQQNGSLWLVKDAAAPNRFFLCIRYQSEVTFSDRVLQHWQQLFFQTCLQHLETHTVKLEMRPLTK